MSGLLRSMSAYSKSIIFVCIFALLVAGLTVRSFDPFHPKILTSECMQAPLLCTQKLGGLSLLGIGVWLARKTGYSSLLRVLDSQYYIGQNLLAYTSLMYIYDPVKQSLRLGKLRRIEYL